MMTVFWIVAAVVIAASFIDLGIGVVATLVSDVWHALRRLVRRLAGTDRT